MAKRTKTSSCNNQDSFSDEWATSVARFYKVVLSLKEEKWDAIFVASEKHLLDVPKAGAGLELKRLLNAVQQALKDREKK